jgi:hypothetical protein
MYVVERRISFIEVIMKAFGTLDNTVKREE